MKYLLANLVSGEAEKLQQKMVRDLSERFDAHWLNDYWTPAHFTLKSLFDEQYVSQVESVLEEFAPLNRAFPVTISGFRCFPDCAFMDVQLSPEAHDIYMRLMAELKKIEGMEWDEHEAEDRLFHLSIALFDIDKHYDALCAYLKTIEYSFTVQFDNIALLEQNDAGWIIRRYFSLGA